jgi:tRNA G18 (ribose-2'-O)-methylase SpoU
MKTYVILHNIRSAHNVGSIFRTADGAGISKLYLTGYTPAPVDRFGRTDEKMAKVALGATTTVPYETQEDVASLIEKLKQEGVVVAAVELTPSAEDISAFKESRDVAYIFGNEIEGITEDILKRTDRQVQIPMRGTKESLNVAVAAGIVLYHDRRPI